MGNNPILLDVGVEHDFFPDPVCDRLAFRPDDRTASELASRRIHVRCRPGGFRIHRMPDSILDRDVPCTLFARTDDPLFELYTDLSLAGRDRILSFSDERISEDGATLQASGAPLPPGAATRQARISVDFTLASADERHRRLRIRLRSRESFWKYHLFGEFSRRPIQIVDSSSTDERIDFRPAETMPIPGAISWISDRPIPARQRAEQRIQLRDTETGRVLVKRLPNPDFRTIGREPLRSGGSALVVEAFIHP